MKLLLPRAEKSKGIAYIYVDEVRAERKEVLDDAESLTFAYLTSTSLEHAIQLIYMMRKHFANVIVDFPTDYLGVALAYELRGCADGFAYTFHFTDKPINTYCKKKIKEIMR